MLIPCSCSGKEVVPILTKYEGVGDCFTTILREEGVRGLFKVIILVRGRGDCCITIIRDERVRGLFKVIMVVKG
jgi:hypothetical protein